MVLAIAGLCQVAGWSLTETAHVANSAAGLDIEQVGIAPVSWDQIDKRYSGASQKPLEDQFAPMNRPQPCTKITTLSQLQNQITQIQLPTKQ